MEIIKSRKTTIITWNTTNERLTIFSRCRLHSVLFFFYYGINGNRTRHAGNRSAINIWRTGVTHLVVSSLTRAMRACYATKSRKSETREIDAHKSLITRAIKVACFTCKFYRCPERSFPSEFLLDICFVRRSNWQDIVAPRLQNQSRNLMKHRQLNLKNVSWN